MGDRESTIRAIHRAIERGMTHVDTAEVYGNGEVERLLGEALTGHRGGVFLATKIHPDHGTYAGTLLACEKSLKRLRTDRIDLFLLHWRGTLPLEETFRAFEVLKQEGKIRAWGVSNFDATDLEDALRVAPPGAIACNQVLYHLEERDAEHVLVPTCTRNGIALVAYSPLGSGSFPAPGSWAGDVLAGIAARHAVSPRAVALRYLLRLPSTFVIPKTSRAAHVDALAAAGDLTLTDDELGMLGRVFPLGPPRSRLPIV